MSNKQIPELITGNKEKTDQTIRDFAIETLNDAIGADAAHLDEYKWIIPALIIMYKAGIEDAEPSYHPPQQGSADIVYVPVSAADELPQADDINPNYSVDVIAIVNETPMKGCFDLRDWSFWPDGLDKNYGGVTWLKPVLSGEAGAVEVLNFLASEDLQREKFNDRIILCDGDYYWESDEDGDMPLSPETIIKLFKQSQVK